MRAPGLYDVPELEYHADLAEALDSVAAAEAEREADRRESQRLETCEERDYNTPERNPDV